MANLNVSLCGAMENLAINISSFPNSLVNHPAILCPGNIEAVITTKAFTTYGWRNEGGTEISIVPSPNLGPGYSNLVVTNSTDCEGQYNFEIAAYPSREASISTPGLGVYVWWLQAEVLVCGRREVSVFEKGDVTVFR